MFRKLTALFVAALLICTTATLTAQNVGIGTTTPNASAALDVQSTTQGMLVPRMTAAQRGAIAAPVATGLLVYQTDGTAGFYFYNGTAWTSLSGGTTYTAGTGISLTGGVITNTGDNDNNSTNEIELPTQTGNSGKFLTTNGTSASWATPSGGSAATLQLSVNATDGINYGSGTGALFTVDYGTATTNVGAQYDAATNIFTVSETGLYHIRACLGWNSASSGVIGVYVNNALKIIGTVASNGTGTQVSPFTRAAGVAVGILQLSANDQVKVMFNTNASTTTSVGSVSDFTIVKL